MADSLFLITGGGTGAKVAEALVHLCAAGAAPKTVHILLVDADATNGNLQRAKATADTYQDLQRWPWSVETTTGSGIGRFFGGGESHSLTLFGSELHVTELTEPLDTTSEGGISAQATGDMALVLDLLYDREEQTASADDGFRARPNLGCLVLADHLDAKLEKRAGPFLDALTQASSGGKVVPVVVTASIFGGTGASLLPVARGAVEAALKARHGGQGAGPVAKALKWGAVMVLPHYQPTHRKKSVDPERFLLDTSNALQFYGMAQVASGDLYDAVYAIGSDRPGRNRVKPMLGQKAQSNPAYIEELVAAAAVLDFAEAPGHGQPVHIFAPDRGQDRLGWTELPYGGGRLGERVAYLLHLAAFYLRPGDAHRQELTRGLAALMKHSSDADLETNAWFQDILHPWASELSPAYAKTPAGRRATAMQDPSILGEQAAGALRPAAVEYFGRLLLWAATALRDGSDGVLQLVSFLTGEHYSLLYGEMSRIGVGDIDAAAPGDQTIDPEHDNALARALRAALAAEVNAHERNRTKGIVAGSFALLEPDGTVGLRITPQLAVDALAAEGLSAVAEEYTRTAVDAALAA